MESLFFCGGDLSGFLKTHYSGLNRQGINLILNLEPETKFCLFGQTLKFDFYGISEIGRHDYIESADKKIQLQNLRGNVYRLVTNNTSDFITAKQLTGKFSIKNPTYERSTTSRN